MNWLDIAIIVSTGVLFLLGWKLGVVHLAVVAVGSFLGITLASRFKDEVEPAFSALGLGDNWAEVSAFIAIFTIALAAALAAGSMLTFMSKRLKIGWADNVIGAALGLVVSLAVWSTLLSTVQSHPVLGLESTVEGSALGTFLADRFDLVLKGIGFIPDDLGE